MTFLWHYLRRLNTEHNDTQQNDIQQKGTQHKDIQQWQSVFMLNIANYLFILSVIMECRYADCRGALITAVKKLNRTCQFVLL